MLHVSFTDFNQRPAHFMDRAIEDRDSILITRQDSEPIVMLSQHEFDGLMETVHLLSSPANAERLLASIADAKSGKLEEHELLR